MSELHDAILRVLREGTVLHGTSLMTREMKDAAHESQMAANLVAAIEPLIEQKGTAAPDSTWTFPGPSARMDAIEDRIGDLETWRADIVDKIRLQTNQTTRDLASILQRLDAFDAKGTATINRFKDVNNAIERLERQVFGGIQPRDAKYVYPHIDERRYQEMCDFAAGAVTAIENLSRGRGDHQFADAQRWRRRLATIDPKAPR